MKVQMIDPDRLAAADARPYWSTTRYADTQAESFARAGCVPHGAWEPVRSRCEQRGVAFVATPFDLGALDPLAALQPDAVKIASGDLTYRDLVEGCADRFPQLIVSTGAADDGEVLQAARWVRRHHIADPAYRSVWLACSLEYPTPPRRAHLARIATLGRLVHHAVGYSDHTVQSYPDEARAMGTAVGVAGAVLAEKHCMMEAPADGVPDTDMAMTPGLFGAYVTGIATGFRLLGSPDLGVHSGEADALTGARRSMLLAADLSAGHVLTGADLEALRPCPPGAAPASQVPLLLGKPLAAYTPAGRIMRWSLVDGKVQMVTEPVAP